MIEQTKNKLSQNAVFVLQLIAFFQLLLMSWQRVKISSLSHGYNFIFSKTYLFHPILVKYWCCTFYFLKTNVKTQFFAVMQHSLTLYPTNTLLMLLQVGIRRFESIHYLCFCEPSRKIVDYGFNHYPIVTAFIYNGRVPWAISEITTLVKDCLGNNDWLRAYNA